ncbi:MAG: hypothetical protein ACRCWR_09430 [Saezia sp.]
MKTDLDFLFTDKAKEAVAEKGKGAISFETPANMPVFLVGDLITFEQLDPDLMFRVRSRYFIWKNENQLLIRYVLGHPNEGKVRSSTESLLRATRSAQKEN